MKTILVIGLGKVGSLVGILLSKRFQVTGFDKQEGPGPLPFDVIQGNIDDVALLEKTLASFDAVVSCLP